MTTTVSTSDGGNVELPVSLSCARASVAMSPAPCRASSAEMSDLNEALPEFRESC